MKKKHDIFINPVSVGYWNPPSRGNSFENACHNAVVLEKKRLVLWTVDEEFLNHFENKKYDNEIRSHWGVKDRKSSRKSPFFQKAPFPFSCHNSLTGADRAMFLYGFSNEELKNSFTEFLKTGDKKEVSSHYEGDRQKAMDRFLSQFKIPFQSSNSPEYDKNDWVYDNTLPKTGEFLKNIRANRFDLFEYSTFFDLHWLYTDSNFLKEGLGKPFSFPYSYHIYIDGKGNGSIFQPVFLPLITATSLKKEDAEKWIKKISSQTKINEITLENLKEELGAKSTSYSSGGKLPGDVKSFYLLALPEQQKILVNFKSLSEDKFEWESKASKEELEKLFSPLASYAGDDDQFPLGTFGKGVLNTINRILEQVQLYLQQEEEDKKSQEIDDWDDNDWDDDDWDDDDWDDDVEEESKESFLLETPLGSLKSKKEETKNSPNISDIIQNLKDLSLLHKDGILNDEEFEQIKSHLLNGIK